MCDSDHVLGSMGLVYVKFVDQAVKPAKSSVKASNYIHNCGNCNICSYQLYCHQRRTIEALLSGKNVILTAETGSGKTEAWLIYAIRKIQEDAGFKTLAIYPTKALSHDQALRIYDYLDCLGFSVGKKGSDIYGDLVRYDGDTNRNKAVKSSLPSAKIIITNPEMLVRNFHIVYPNLVVVDELDFYDSHKATLLIKLLKDHYPRAQMVIMSGTLSNPTDLANYIGNAEVISGKGFKPETRYYVIIGKEDKVRNAYDVNELRNLYGRFVSYEEFKENFFQIYYEAASRQSPLASKMFDAFLREKSEIEEILKKYKDECTGELSLVFFRSIAEAHNYSAPLGIPEHHSKVKKTERLKLEEEMKNNIVNVVSSVKTLQQGIDIGHVKRIIHVGIPLLVKDFRQREGRKGRREDINFVESVIIPQGFDPRLYDGINSLLTWSSISPEIVVFNINNYYLTLWDALSKLCNSQPLSNQEEVILKRFNMIDSSGKPTKSNICNSISRFYDIQGNPVKVFFGDPPQQVDNISFKDMIENYQPGSIDISNNAVVTKIEKKSSFNVYESDINGVDESCISLAIGEYNATLKKWGIVPNIDHDIKLGKVISKVYTNILFDGEGFVIYNEVPAKVVWFVESRSKLGDDYLYHKIDLVCRPFPRRNGYKDFTYAYLLEIRDTDYVDEGMAYLITALRLFYGIRVDLIKYFQAGNILKVWEEKPVGLLEMMRRGGVVINNQKLDLHTFINYLVNVNEDQKFKTIFFSVFPVRGKIDWNKAKITAIILAIKLFNYYTTGHPLVPPINLNLRPGYIIVDSINFGKGTIFSISYYELGSVITETFDDEDQMTRRLFELAYRGDFKAVITTHKLNDRLITVLKAFDCKIIKIDEKIPGVTPSDYSKEVRKMLNNLTTSEEVDIKKLFRIRAGIIQEIGNKIERNT